MSLMIVAGSYEEYRTYCKNRDIDPLVHHFVDDPAKMRTFRNGVVVYTGSYARRLSIETLGRIRSMCIVHRHLSIVDNR